MGDWWRAGRIFFGTTLAGGTNQSGTVFRINQDGSGYVELRDFAYTNGDSPSGELLLNGATLYGTTADGGAGGYGEVFKINTDGTGFSVIHNFAYGDGAYPEAGLVLGGGTHYGTTFPGGGSGNVGTVFKINTDGTGFSVIRGLTANTDGSTPTATLAINGSTALRDGLPGWSRQFGHGVHAEHQRQ